MIKIVLNKTTYLVNETSNGINRTLIDILKNKIVSYLLEECVFYDTMKLSQGSFEGKKR